MDEKIAMGDGRFDQDTLTKAIKEHAHDALLIDMDALAKQSGSIISAVMLGTIAGSGRLPLTAEQLEAAIRADGKSVDSNLRGFRAGLEAARAKTQTAKLPDKKKRAAATLQALEDEVLAHRSRRMCAPSSSRACGGWWPIRARPTREPISTGWWPSPPPTPMPAPRASC